jgi:hypothetical protein
MLEYWNDGRMGKNGRGEDWNDGMMERSKSGKKENRFATTKTQFDSAHGGREHEGGFDDRLLLATAYVGFWFIPVFQCSIIPPFRRLA